MARFFMIAALAFILGQIFSSYCIIFGVFMGTHIVFTALFFGELVIRGLYHVRKENHQKARY